MHVMINCCVHELAAGNVDVLHAHVQISLDPAPFLHAGGRAGRKKGPGIHCLRMRYFNLMNLIIKALHDTQIRHK